MKESGYMRSGFRKLAIVVGVLAFLLQPRAGFGANEPTPTVKITTVLPHDTTAKPDKAYMCLSGDKITESVFELDITDAPEKKEELDLSMTYVWTLSPANGAVKLLSTDEAKTTLSVPNVASACGKYNLHVEVTWNEQKAADWAPPAGEPFGEVKREDNLLINILKVDLIIPAGDPVALPDDAGDGQNEFTYLKASTGVLTMNLKAKVTPAGIATTIKNQFRFTVGTIGSSVLAWDDANPGGKPTANGDILEATVTFSGLPANNTDFGTKLAAVFFNGNKCSEEDYEVFYNATAANHPGGTASDPNWFYYYKQNAGGGEYTYKSIGRSDSATDGGDDSVAIANEAYAGDKYIRTKVTAGQLDAIGWSGITKYYANFLGVLAHERQHANNQTIEGPPTDADRDWLSNKFEKNTSKTDPNDAYSARGVLEGAGYPDREVYAGGPVEEAGIAGADTSKDWADPGTNSKP